MEPLRISGHIDEHHRLSAVVPSSLPTGPVTVVIVPANPEEGNSHWMSGIAQLWQDELADKRQDIYTLEDGESPDAA